jgi:hypothetical protein
MTTTSKDAKKTLAELEKKLTSAKAEHAEATAAAKALAFDAFTIGGAAQERLAALHAQAGALAAELTSLEAAIQEAQRRLAEALAYEAGEAGRAAAVRRFAILESMAARCARLDAIFAKENAELQALFDEYDKAGLEGERPCSRDMFRVSTKNARLAALQAGPLEVGEKFLAPFQRHTLVETVGSAVKAAMVRATATINAGKSEKAA